MNVRLFTFIILFFCTNSFVNADEIEPVHYAYANYLGSGIYRTTGQNASLISMPFSYELGHKGKLSYGLRLPVSIGFFDFDFADLPNLDLPDEVGTITFTPGIAFNYQYSKNLLIESYIDVGYGRNLTTNKGVNIHSSGVSALYHFEIKKYDSIWANRIYIARYDGNGYDAQDSYAALQIGLDTGLPVQYQILGYQFQPRIFATAFWYFSEVDFFMPRTQALDEGKNISLTNSIELGFTLKFAKTLGYSWAGIDRLGLSYRYSKNFSAVRLLFSFPI
ncbi:hypothetical protein CMT41_06585 [Colwellia sp. MT41]|uniref:Outer membrane protein n=2 Tax=Colwelliaceae TaxID=267889 RepID=A0ABQ0MYI1_9GAMM|nr:hypothetical protein CMT41_06585 [Colwellia sp. MT41]GAW97431.1 outer membrane protein [Colwellia marinimaniae]